MPTDAPPDPYEVLGVAPDADFATIKRAYRRLMRSAHPDYAGTAGLFRMVQTAYDALTSGNSPTSTAAHSSHTPTPSHSDRSDPSAERQRAEDERINEEFRRRREQAYADHPDDPWLAEFTARQGEEHRASAISDADLKEALREMMKRGMSGTYPVPSYWAENMRYVRSVFEHQDRLRRQICEEDKAAKEAAEVAAVAAAKAARERRRAALADREHALGSQFKTAGRARRDLLALWMFRGKEAQSISTVGLAELRRRIKRMRRLPVAIGAGLPTLAVIVISVDGSLISYSNMSLGSIDLFWALTGLTLVIGWLPPTLAYWLHAPEVENLLRYAATVAPYRGELADRQDWLETEERKAGTAAAHLRLTASLRRRERPRV